MSKLAANRKPFGRLARGAVVGLLAIILAFVTFVSTLLLHALAAHAPRQRDADSAEP